MEEKGDYNPEEEVITGNWNTPKVSLKEVEVRTGEEDETLFWSGRSKLYRWVNGEWKERGLGESKLLKHKEKGTIRFLLRQEKTLKIVANHFIYPTESYCKLVPNAGSEKIYAWTVKDFAEEPRIEQFALKFNTPEAAKTFKQKFDEAGENNKKLMNLVDEKGEVKEDAEKGKEKKAEKEKEKDNDKDKEKGKETEKTGDKKEEGDKKDQDKEKDAKVENDTKKIAEKENDEKRVEETKENKKEKTEEEKNETKRQEESNVKVVEKEKKHAESKIEDESKKVEKKEEQNSKVTDEQKNAEKSGEKEENLKREDN